MNKEIPILIENVSKEPINFAYSLGIKFGGIKSNGHEYVYIQDHDSFLRKDHLSQYEANKDYINKLKSEK
jgi:hypothetical protein